jgi:hypothetical protein
MEDRIASNDIDINKLVHAGKTSKPQNIEDPVHAKKGAASGMSSYSSLCYGRGHVENYHYNTV